MLQSRSAKIAVPSNLYTAILAVAFAVVLATAAFVAFKCFTQYETIFGMP
jgi:flagellin-like protein